MNKQELAIVMVLFAVLIGWGFWSRPTPTEGLPPPADPPIEAPVDAPLSPGEAGDPFLATPRPEAPAEAPAGADAPVEADASEAQADAAVKPLFETPAGDPDDLKKITGVGPSLERRLRDLGVTKIEQIANFSDEDVENVDAVLNFKGRIQRDDWVGQAKALVTGAA